VGPRAVLDAVVKRETFSGSRGGQMEQGGNVPADDQAYAFFFMEMGTLNMT
jgi:hypothetical protein